MVYWLLVIWLSIQVQVWIICNTKNNFGARDGVQMVYWPVTVIFGTTTDFLHPLRDIVGEWYCSFGYFWIVGGMTLILFHSFVVGLMRYIFVVHNERVVSYGKEKAKKMFFLASILIPVFLTLWGFLNGRDESAITSLNKCYGVHHKAYF